MSGINTSIDASKDLTVFTVRGEVCTSDVLSAIEAFYQGSPTSLVLWDLSAAVLAGVSAGDVSGIARMLKQTNKRAQRGKTALVGSEGVNFGMARMFESMAEMEDMPTEYAVFRTLEEARQWLGVE